MKWSSLLFLVAATAAADDGSWSADRDSTASPGALYSAAGAVPVVMEKEYLELTDVESGATKAVFQFRNTSAKEQIIECAFPIEVKYDYRGGIVLTPRGVVSGETGGQALIDVGFGTDKYGNSEGIGNSVAVWFPLLGLKLTSWNPSSLGDDEGQGNPYGGFYLPVDQYPRGTKTYDAAALAKTVQLRITQDGTPVSVKECVVDFGAEPGRLVFHFRHQMKLAASGSTRLEVRYSWPTLAAEYHDSGVRHPMNSATYVWNYILETASSWQGRLGTLVLAVPPGPQLPLPWMPLGFKNGRMLYQRMDAKPTPADNLALSWETSKRDWDALWSDRDVERLGAEPFRENKIVRYVGASSELGDKADVYLPDGVMNAPFTGDRLFDGFRETAWAVHTAQGGVGETVSFVLKTAAGVIAVQNGYLRSINDYAPKATASFYAKNNRVKKFSVIGPGGTTSLELADKRDGLQYFNVALGPGTYQIRIDAIYAGSRYNDTCLGELLFLPGNPLALAALEKDTFFASSW